MRAILFLGYLLFAGEARRVHKGDERSKSSTARTRIDASSKEMQALSSALTSSKAEAAFMSSPISRLQTLRNSRAHASMDSNEVMSKRDRKKANKKKDMSFSTTVETGYESDASEPASEPGAPVKPVSIGSSSRSSKLTPMYETAEEKQTSTSGPAPVWNPENLDAPKLPNIPGVKLFEQQFVPEYCKGSPKYLSSSLAGDIGFDPWCLVALAKPNMDMDKKLRTAEERKQKMLSMSAEEQAESVAWMRDAELKHGRLAMLAAAGWPIAELVSGNSMAATNGRAPSLFNGHLLDYLPALLVIFGGLSYLEYSTKDTVKNGDFGFDPLGIATGKGPIDIPKQIPNVGDLEALKLAEMKNGRAAMMAITGFAVQEFVRGIPVVQQTPIFFHR